MEYLYRTHTSTGASSRKAKRREGQIYTGDLLEPYRDHIDGDMFYGFDFDVTMLRISRR